MRTISSAIHRGLSFIAGIAFDELPITRWCLTLEALHEVGAAAEARQRLATRLHDQLSDQWLTTAPLREVFLVVNALRRYDSRLITGETLALVVGRLIRAEIKPGGPYRDDNTELDIFTNVAIQEFATWAAAPLPNISSFLDSQAALDPHAVQYRAARTPAKPPTGATAQRLINSQLPNGSWGNDIAATALAVKSLHAIDAPVPARNKQHHKVIFARAHSESTVLSPEIQEPMQTMLAKLAKANVHAEITDIAAYTAQAFGRHLPPETHTLLGLANVYGWLAYTLYDDILDNDARGEYLSLANIAMRRSYQLYTQAVPEAAALITDTFTAVDEANAWELRHARAPVTHGMLALKAIPSYKNRLQLARRSYIHVLGPMLAASSANPPQNILQKGFEHYLIARQLTDDLHDWIDDVQNGQITHIVALILRDLRQKPGRIELARLVPRMQQCFINRTCLKSIEQIQAHCNNARKFWALAGLELTNNGLHTLLARLENSAQEAKILHKDTVTFRNVFARNDALNAKQNGQPTALQQ